MRFTTEKLYVYTAAGEQRGRECGQDWRKEGEIATIGKHPVYGLFAKAWLEKGWIREVTDADG